MNKHNHEPNNSLRIYGTCPACDVFYQKLLLNVDTKDEHREEESKKY